MFNKKVSAPMEMVLKPLRWCEDVLATIAGILIMLMMVLTALDVVMRYVFNAPLSWVFDIVTHYMLVASFFFSFSIALRFGEHVAVDYFVTKFNAAHHRTALSVAWLACGFLAGVIAVTAALEANLAWKQAEVIAGVIPWPIWVQKAIVAAGMVPLAGRLLLLGIGADKSQEASSTLNFPERL